MSGLIRARSRYAELRADLDLARETDRELYLELTRTIGVLDRKIGENTRQERDPAMRRHDAGENPD